MPFTLAHPAAVVPFHGRLGRTVPLSALVVGSIAPDLTYFLPLGVSGSYSHTLTGLLLFCLPVGTVAWVIFRVLVRPFLLALLPRLRPERIPNKPVKWSVQLLTLVGAAVLVGAVTHVLWDSFTHSTGFVVRLVPAMSTPIGLFDSYQPRLFTILQHASTLGGLAVLAVFALRWFHGAVPRERHSGPSLPIWPRLVAVTALLMPSVAVGLGVLRRHLTDGNALFPVLQNYLGRAIFSAGSAFLGMLLLLALLWRAWEAWSGQRRACPTDA